jgi:hypothetical protein
VLWPSDNLLSGLQCCICFLNGVSITEKRQKKNTKNTKRKKVKKEEKTKKRKTTVRVIAKE